MTCLDRDMWCQLLFGATANQRKYPEVVSMECFRLKLSRGEKIAREEDDVCY